MQNSPISSVVEKPTAAQFLATCCLTSYAQQQRILVHMQRGIFSTASDRVELTLWYVNLLLLVFFIGFIPDFGETRMILSYLISPPPDGELSQSQHPSFHSSTPHGWRLFSLRKWLVGLAGDGELACSQFSCHFVLPSSSQHCFGFNARQRRLVLWSTKR